MATGLPKSTVHRLAEQLCGLGWLERDPIGYRVGLRLFEVGSLAERRSRLRDRAAPHLNALFAATSLTVQLAILDGVSIIYLERILAPGSRIPTRDGGRQPAYCTALGKAMLAWLEPEQVDALLGDNISRLTSRTIGELGTLHQELHRIRRRRGLAFERGESFPGIACVAAAIRGAEGPVAGISLVGDIHTPLENVAPLVVTAARETAQVLFPGSAAAGRGGRTRRTHADRPVPEHTWSAATMNRLLAVDGRGDWM
jgi:DNA-binding IclR family transcriptional regulator